MLKILLIIIFLFYKADNQDSLSASDSHGGNQAKPFYALQVSAAYP